jgi:hypothetical protein
MTTSGNTDAGIGGGELVFAVGQPPGTREKRPSAKAAAARLLEARSS